MVHFPFYDFWRAGTNDKKAFEFLHESDWDLKAECQEQYFINLCGSASCFLCRKQLLIAALFQWYCAGLFFFFFPAAVLNATFSKCLNKLLVLVVKMVRFEERWTSATRPVTDCFLILSEADTIKFSWFHYKE